MRHQDPNAPSLRDAVALLNADWWPPEAVRVMRAAVAGSEDILALEALESEGSPGAREFLAFWEQHGDQVYLCIHRCPVCSRWLLSDWVCWPTCAEAMAREHESGVVNLGLKRA